MTLCSLLFFFSVCEFDSTNKYAVREMILITLLCECCCCCWGVLRLKQTVLFLPASHEPLFYPHSMCRSQLNDKQCGWWWWISDRFFFHRFISSSLDDLVSLFPHTKHRKNRAITMHALSHPMTLLVCVRAHNLCIKSLTAHFYNWNENFNTNTNQNCVFVIWKWF